MTDDAAAAYLRRIARAIVIGAVLALLVGGCGGGGTKPANGADASLRVKHVLDPAAEEHYMEGSIWHVRVVDSDESAVLDEKLARQRLGTPRNRPVQARKRRAPV